MRGVSSWDVWLACPCHDYLEAWVWILFVRGILSYHMLLVVWFEFLYAILHSLIADLLYILSCA